MTPEHTEALKVVLDAMWNENPYVGMMVGFFLAMFLGALK